MDDLNNSIKQITARLRHMMETLGLNAKKFAELADIPPATLSQTLDNRNNPTLPTLLKISKGFPEWSLSWIISGEGPERIEISKNQEGINDDFAPLFSFESTDNKDSMRSKSMDFSNQKNDPTRVLTADFISKVVSETLIQKATIETRSISEIRVFYTDGSFETFILK